MSYSNFAYRPSYKRHYGGLITSDTPEDLEVHESPDLLNVRPLGKGQYGPRNGIERIGDEVTATGVIRSLFTFRRVNTETLIRSRKTTMEYLKTSNSTWTVVPDIGTLTNDLDFGFANDEQNVFFGNGVDALTVWDGNDYASVALTSVDTSGDTITKASHGLVSGDIIKFTTSGTLPAGLATSTAYFVVSPTTNTFQVSTTRGGSAVDITDSGTGTHSYQSTVKTYSSNPKGNILEFYLRRLFIAGDPDAPATVYYSKTGNPFDFTFSTPRVADDGGSIVIGDGGDAITSLKMLITPDGNSSVVIYKKSRRVYGLTLATDGTPTLKELKRGTGAVNDRGTIIVENDVMYADEDNNIQTLGFRENISNDLTKEQASNNIDDATPDLDFQDVCAWYYRKEKFVIYSVRKYNSDFNDVQFVYYRKWKSWWKWEGLNANQFAEYAGQLVWASSTDQNVYALTSGFDDLGNVIKTYRSTRDEDLRTADVPGADMRFKQCRFIFVQGYISPNGSIDFNAIFNGDESQKQTVTIGGTDTPVQQGVSIAFGRTVYGRQVFGGSAQSPTSFPLNWFYARISLELYSFLKMRIVPEQQKAGAPYVITSIVPYISLMPDEHFPDGNKV